MKVSVSMKRCLPLLLFAVLAASCSKDTLRDDPGNGRFSEDEITTVLFSMSIPGAQSPGTRAMTEKDEHEIEAVDVLVFENDALFHRAPGVLVSNAQLEKKNFQVRLPIGGPYDLIVLSNARSVLNVAGLDEGASKEDVEKALVKSVSAGSKYSENRVPMFGYRNALTVDENTDLTDKTASGGADNSLKMIRMMSRIDVELTAKAASGTDDGQGNDNFALSEVYLYNYSTRGSMIPDLAATNWDGVNHKAKKPTEPNGGYGAAGAGEEVLFDSNDDSGSTLPNALRRAIYTFEAPAGSSSTPESNPCVVIGGSYKGGGETYYRVDLIEKGTKDYLALLRNHIYKISILSISGPGYPTPGEAFASTAVNVEADIVAWSEGDMNDITFDGQYQLSVDKSELSFGLDAGKLAMNVYADHPKGWAVEIADQDQDWLSVTPSSDNSGGKMTVQVGVTKTDKRRSGVFFITAGKLRKPIQVSQSEGGENVTITVTPNRLVFRATGRAKTVTVETFPTNLVRFMTSTGKVVWAQGAGPDDYSGKGEDAVFSFCPTDNNTGEILTGFVTIYVEHNGELVQQTITVKQLATDLMFDVEHNIFPAAGGVQSFVVTSELPWSFTKSPASDPLGIVTLTDESGEYPGSDTDRTPYFFELAANPGYASRKTSLIPQSSDESFSAPWVEIEQAGTPPLITLSKAEHNFGTGTAAYADPFTTNATQWSYTLNNTNVATGNLAAGTLHGGSSGATSTATPSLVFTPKTEVPDGTTLAAGTELTAEATFTTSVGAAGVAENSKTLTLKRTVPEYWTWGGWNLAEGATVPRTGAKVTATATSNAVWTVTSNPAGTTASAPTGSYASRSVEYAIPDQTDLDWDERNIVVTAKGPGNTGSSSITLKQRGISPTFKLSRTTLQCYGDLVTVTVSGTGVPDFHIRFADGDVAQGMNTVGNTGARTIRAGQNGGTTSRSLALEYRKGTEGDWFPTGLSIQQGVYKLTYANIFDYKNQGLVNGANKILVYENCPSGYRIPRTTELMQIWAYRPAISGIPSEEIWSTSGSAVSGSYLKFTSGFLGSTSSPDRYDYHVLCVKEI